MPEATRVTNPRSRVLFPRKALDLKQVPDVVHGIVAADRQRHTPFAKLVQSVSLQQSPANSGWTRQEVRHRIANGAGWQSVSRAHGFEQYSWPEPTHTAGASEVEQM